MPEYSFHRGSTSFNSTDVNQEFNKDGAILFNKSTNKLYFNVGEVSSEETKKTNRREVKVSEADHATKSDTANVSAYLGDTSSDYSTREKIANAFKSVNDAISALNKTFMSLTPSTITITTTNTTDTAFKINNALTITGAGNLTTTGDISAKNLALTGKLTINGDTVLTSSEVQNKLNNLITQPFFVQNGGTPTTAQQKLLWIDTSSGNGVLKYYYNGSWKPISAVYT